jgi:low temperature requirement protein LtrA
VLAPRGLRAIRRRDPEAAHRTATPLELLFDLAFVIAFGQAADQLTHQLAFGHIAVGVGGFGFAILTIVSAWASFTWFGSAYGTDDWVFRTATMVQMVGVVVLTLGLPELFRTLEQGSAVDVRVMIAGYLVMRAATLFQWGRVALQAPTARRSALQHAGLVLISMVGWLIIAIVTPPVPWFFAAAVALFALEISGTRIVEKRSGEMTWHPHHIAERFGLLAIIALGEGVFGTVASVSALIERAGWSADAIIVVIAGVGLTFGLWWMYFMVPFGWVLERFRGQFQPFLYLHFVIYTGIVATGAGLHVAALTIEDEGTIGVFGASLAVIIPVAAFLITLMISYTFMQRAFDRLHAWLFIITTGVLILATALAAGGALFAVTLPLATLAPAISVIGYEITGWRHQQEALRRLDPHQSSPDRRLSDQSSEQMKE